MATLSTLVPTAYSSQTGTTWTTTTVGNIDNTVAGADGAYLVSGSNATATIFYEFTNTPSTFAKMTTLTYNIRYAIASLSGDTEVLYVQIFKADKTTALTNEMTVVTRTASITNTNTGNISFTGVDTNATKTEWDNAFIRIRVAHSTNMGADGSVWSIDEVELGGTYNSPPTVALNSPADAASTSDTTPTLDFTGTDAESNDIRYNIQIALDTPISDEETIDSYPESNFATNLVSHSGSNPQIGQSFLNSNAITLKSVQCYLARVLSATGTFTAKIYAHSGTFGTSSIPTGSALATSDSIDITTLGANALVTLNFSGANQITLAAGTHYVLVIDASGITGDSSNNLGVGSDSSSPTHSGNLCRWRTDLGAYEALSGFDLIFYIFGSNVLLNKISGTDSGFANPDNGGDTDPFTSGENIQYTVQGGDALADDTYYWRVRGIDPSGSNTYGEWSSTRSFTVSGGYTLACTTQTYTLTGIATGLRIDRDLNTDVRSYTLTGVNTGLSRGYVMAADTASFTLTGVTSGLTVSRLITATTQTYTLTGINTGVLYGRLMTQTVQTYVLTGVSNIIFKGYQVLTDTGTYTLSGIDSGLLAGRNVIATQQTYTLSGVATGLLADRELNGEVQTYTLTGIDVGLTYGAAVCISNLLQENGDFLFQENGDNILLEQCFEGTYQIDAEVATYILTGVDTGFTVARKIDATVQTYTLTGIDATFTVSRRLDATVQTYILIGINTGLLSTRLLTADQQTYVLNGVDAELDKGYALTTDTSTYTLSGIDAGLTLDRVLGATTQTYTLSLIDGDFDVGEVLNTVTQTYTLTGIDVILTVSRRLDGTTQTYVLTGIDSELDKGYLLTTDTQSYVLSLVDAELDAGKRINADVQTYILTGIDAGLRVDRLVTLDTQTYTLTGVDAEIDTGKRINSDVQTYILSGVDVLFEYSGDLVSGNIKYWDGADWLIGQLKYYNGSIWVDAELKVYNGATWDTITY